MLQVKLSFLFRKPETDPPFELFIMGNKTQPLFDRRRGKIIEDTQELLCSFDFNFPCLWGPEAGRWAIIDKGNHLNLLLSTHF